MNANDVIDSGVVMPRIAKVQCAEGLRLSVLWAEGLRAGKTDVIDLSPAIDSYKFYRPLRGNDALFKTARLVDDGHTVVWGEGELDMSAATIEALAEETMTPEDFAAFLVRNDLTQAAAASVLGRSRRQIAYYLNPGPVPRVIALACHGYEALRGKGNVRGGGGEADESKARRMSVDSA